MEYHCTSCDMGVKGLTCTHCDKPLEPATLSKEGKKIQIAKCPSDCGAINAPRCCGHEMEAKTMKATK